MPGRIDIHTHLLPAIDDGCTLPEQAITTIRALIERGYSTCVCTPHIWPDIFPGNTPQNIAYWTEQLSKRLAEEQVAFQLLPGGEARLFKDAVRWMKNHGVPTLGPSKAVLLDTWDDGFPKHAYKTLDWLLAEGYRPVLAHPERSRMGTGFASILERLAGQGVLIQGNLMPFAGHDLPGSEDLAWRFLEEGRYDILALDLHRPNTLDNRLAGLDLVEKRIGSAALDRLIAENPRRLLADEPIR